METQVDLNHLGRKKPETVPCKWCGFPTVMIGTRECDRCWELRSRISHHYGLAKIMIEEMENPKQH